ncbi:MAG: RNA polymerase sigma factor [Deltaproteobacteria bacterium]|nr:RNA polymerase sigma factor [Deltaproteobacteria bacterium]
MAGRAAAPTSAPGNPTEAEPGHGDPPGTDALVAGCCRGEPQAQGALYRAYRSQILGHLYRLLGGPHDLEDALQDTFVEAFRSIGKFRGDAKLSTWLHGIAVHIALRRLRSRGRQPREAAVDESALAADALQARTVEARRQVARVFAILEHLPPKKRVVFVLHEIDGLPLTEIAQMVGAPQITVRTRLHYARKEFFRRVAQDPAFDGYEIPVGGAGGDGDDGGAADGNGAGGRP